MGSGFRGQTQCSLFSGGGGHSRIPAPRISLLILGTMVCVSGCAYSAPIHQPGLIGRSHIPQPPTGVAGPPIALSLSTRRTTYHGSPAPGNFRLVSGMKVRRAFNQVRHEFSFLSNARAEYPSAHYRIVMEATDAIDTSVFRDALTGASLFLIPNQLEWTLSLTAGVYEGDTLLRKYEARGQTRIHEHLFFLPVSLWSWNKPSRIRQNVFRDLFLQIEQDSAELFSG